MENIKSWLRNQPLWLKILVAIATAAALAFGTVSCTAQYTARQGCYHAGSGDTTIMFFQQVGKVRK